MKAKYTIVQQSTKPKVYVTRLTVGVQTITFGREYETKAEAKWYIKMMKSAIANLDPAIPEPLP